MPLSTRSRTRPCYAFYNTVAVWNHHVCLFVYVVCCLSPPTSVSVCEAGRGFCHLLTSVPLVVEQWLTHSKHLITICWINKQRTHLRNSYQNVGKQRSVKVIDGTCEVLSQRSKICATLISEENIRINWTKATKDRWTCIFLKCFWRKKQNFPPPWSVLNIAARMFLSQHKSDQVSSSLKTLHWLPHHAESSQRLPVFPGSCKIWSPGILQPHFSSPLSLSSPHHTGFLLLARPSLLLQLCS